MSHELQCSDEPIKFTAPAGGVTTNVPVLIGGQFVIPAVTAAVGESFSGLTMVVIYLTKATGFTMAEGDLGYWDDTLKKFVSDTAKPAVAVCVEDAGSSDTRVKVATGIANIPAFNAVQEFQFLLTPPSGVATTHAFDWIAPCDGQFDSIDLRTAGRPSSSLGTVVETVTNLTGTLNVLTATNVDLEAGITNDTTLTPTLSATAANKQFAAGDVIRFAQTANNADVVAGAGVTHRARWHKR